MNLNGWYEQGLVKYDDPVSKYIPSFSNLTVYDAATNQSLPVTVPLTITHLLTHTSGLTYGFMDPTGPVDSMYNENVRATNGLLTIQQ